MLSVSCRHRNVADNCDQTSHLKGQRLFGWCHEQNYKFFLTFLIKSLTSSDYLQKLMIRDKDIKCKLCSCNF